MIVYLLVMNSKKCKQREDTMPFLAITKFQSEYCRFSFSTTSCTMSSFLKYLLPFKISQAVSHMKIVFHM